MQPTEAMTLMNHPDVFHVYALSSALMVLNLIFITVVTVARRGGNQTFMNPEDKGYKEDATAHPMVDRVLRAHRNALESMVPFFVIGFLFTMTGASLTVAKGFFFTFVVARWIHTFVYLAGKQPFRTISFATGFLCIIGMTFWVLAAFAPLVAHAM